MREFLRDPSRYLNSVDKRSVFIAGNTDDGDTPEDRDLTFEEAEEIVRAEGDS